MSRETRVLDKLCKKFIADLKVANVLCHEDLFSVLDTQLGLEGFRLILRQIRGTRIVIQPKE